MAVTSPEVHIELNKIRNDLISMNTVVTRLDKNIEKLTDIQNSINRLLAVHETRLTTFEKYDDQMKEIHEKVNRVDEKLRDEIKESENKILEELRTIRKEQLEQNSRANDRITKLEKFIYGAVGALVILQIVINNAGNIIRLFGS